MPSASDDVPSIIEREPILQQALERGMINASGAGRWLKDEYELDQNSETIAQHLREFNPDDALPQWSDAREAIKGGQTDIRDGMVLLLVRRAKKSRKRLAEILANLDDQKMEAIRIEPTRRYFQVVVKSAVREDFERHLGDLVEDTVRDLVEISVMTDEPEDAPSPALSAVLRALHGRAVAVPFSTSGPAGITLLVPDSQRTKAHEIVKEMTGASGSNDEPIQPD